MTKTKYIVNVDYQTNSGNPATKRMVVSAWTDNEAIDVATARVRHLKTCMKVNGGSIESPVYSDFDWNAEVARLGEMREKATNYLLSIVKVGEIFPLVPKVDGFHQLYNKGNDGLIFARNQPKKLMDEKFVGELTDQQVIVIAANVQKAIAERTVNP